MDQVTSGLLQGTSAGGFFADDSGAFNISTSFRSSCPGWHEMELSSWGPTYRRGCQELVRAGTAYHIPAHPRHQPGLPEHTNNVRPITSVADLGGLQIPEPSSDLMTPRHPRWVRFLAMPLSEAYQGFQQGVIDDHHNPPQHLGISRSRSPEVHVP